MWCEKCITVSTAFSFTQTTSLSGWGRWKGKVYSSTVFCTFHAVFTLPLLSFFYNVCSHESIKLFLQSFELLNTTESFLVRWRSVSGKVALGLGAALKKIYKRWARYKRWHGWGWVEVLSWWDALFDGRTERCLFRKRLSQFITVDDDGEPASLWMYVHHVTPLKHANPK